VRPNRVLLAVVTIVAVIGSALTMAACFHLPAGWFSLDVWRGVPTAQKYLWGLSTLVLSGVITTFVLVVLGRAARASTGHPSLDAVLEALELGHRVQHRFIWECKGGRGNTTDSLLEDIPSVLGPTEEQRWLDQNDDLDKVQSLLRRSIELEEGTPGPNQQFNIANAYNKLGYHYRFRRGWDRAITALGQAINRLTALAALQGDRQVGRELATAFFHLGEVHMARWRLRGAAEDHREAVRCFERSVQEDAGWGNDDSLARSRLRTLG